MNSEGDISKAGGKPEVNKNCRSPEKLGFEEGGAVQFFECFWESTLRQRETQDYCSSKQGGQWWWIPEQLQWSASTDVQHKTEIQKVKMDYSKLLEFLCEKQQKIGQVPEGRYSQEKSRKGIVS